MPNILDAALELAQQGFLVIPIVPTTKIPITAKGSTEASSDFGVIRDWFEAHPNAGLGLVCGGPRRLVAIDIDSDIGRAGIRDLEAQYGVLPATRTVRSPRGGEHRYYVMPEHYRAEDVRNSAKKICPDVDIRGYHGYCVTWPTPGYSLEFDLPIAQLPEEWARLLAPPKRKAPTAVAQPGSSGTRETAYVTTALARMSAEIASTPEGARNETLKIAAIKAGNFVGAGWASEHTVRGILVDAAIAAGLPQNEAEHTCQRCMDIGKSNPHPPLPDRPRLVKGAKLQPQETAKAKSPDWVQEMVLSAGGVVKNSCGNALLILANEEEFRGVLAFNEVENRIYWHRACPTLIGTKTPTAGEALKDHHYPIIQLLLARRSGTPFTLDNVRNAAEAAAHLNAVDPLRDWLDSIEWDGVNRIDDWLMQYLGARHDKIATMVGKRFLVSAVARVYQPGCQADHVLVLEGEQGCGKSSAVRILAGKYYGPNLGDLRTKDAYQGLDGKWIIEIPELDSFHGTAATRVKDFVTSTVDSYRPSYGRQNTIRPRRCVLIGTTNDDRWIDDATGGRRYWPVQIQTLDRESLVRDRDQLWAEAVVAYRQGYQWHPTDEDAATLREAQDERRMIDPWEGPIAAWCADRTAEFSVAEVLDEACKMARGQWTRRDETRVGIILRRIGAYRRRVMVDGVRAHRYSMPT